MEEISVKGKNYIKAKDIARELGYTNDYIGQLCRAGKVEAELVGRTWYVNPESVQKHKKNRYRSTKASTKRELRTNLLERMKEQEQNSRAHFYEHKPKKQEVNILYETDEADLMPVTTKQKPAKEQPAIELEVELADAKKVEVEAETEKQYHFEAPERKETKFFGTLKVTDFVSEVPVDGTGDELQAVSVRGNVRPKTSNTHQTAAQTESPSEPNNASTGSPKTHKVALHKMQPPVVKPRTVALPVTVDEEEVPIPVFYKLVAPVATVTALLVAALLIGMEATVVANQESVITEYVFAVRNLVAQIFVAK